MPYIEEEQLIELEDDLKKSQLINESLVEQLDIKNLHLQRRDKQKLFLSITSLILLLCCTSLVFFFKNANGSKNSEAKAAANKAYIDSMTTLNARIEALKQENQVLTELRELYLARNFLKNDTIYSVQIKSLSENKISMASNTFTNTIISKNHPYLSFSLGVFETVEEARAFQNSLKKLGFTDAFVASYQEGKRIRIEPKNP